VVKVPLQELQVHLVQTELVALVVLVVQ
jgi:hypothetical protein